MNFRQLIEVRSLLSVVRCQLKKIRVNSRDTWKGFVLFAIYSVGLRPLREESQTPIPKSQSKAKISQTQYQKISAY